MAGQHRAPGRPITVLDDLAASARRLERKTGAIGAVVLLGLLPAGVAASGYSDAASGRATARTYTVPAVVGGPVQTSGTGEAITSRVQATCADPAQMAWRWRDHMAVWGETWNGWSDWSTATSEPGWTAWSTSHLEHPNMPAEVQWQIRCGVHLWTSPETQTSAMQIVRTA